MNIREQADRGQPTVISAPDSSNAQAYLQIARKAAIQIARLHQDISHKFPKIVVQNN
jgi:ATP-binding protein involved in chromosome partitioning